jgi:hypothetical protein
MRCSLVPSCFRTVSGCEDTSRHHRPRTVGATPQCRGDTAPAQPGSDAALGVTVLLKGTLTDPRPRVTVKKGKAASVWAAQVASEERRRAVYVRVRQISRRPAAACSLHPAAGLGRASSWSLEGVLPRRARVEGGMELSAHHLAQAARLAIPCAPSSLPRGLLRATKGSFRLEPPVCRLDAIALAPACSPPVPLTVVLLILSYMWSS